MVVPAVVVSLVSFQQNYHRSPSVFSFLSCFFFLFAILLLCEKENQLTDHIPPSLILFARRLCPLSFNHRSSFVFSFLASFSLQFSFFVRSTINACWSFNKTKLCPLSFFSTKYHRSSFVFSFLPFSLLFLCNSSSLLENRGLPTHASHSPIADLSIKQNFVLFLSFNFPITTALHSFFLAFSLSLSLQFFFFATRKINSHSLYN